MLLPDLPELHPLEAAPHEDDAPPEEQEYEEEDLVSESDESPASNPTSFKVGPQGTNKKN